MSWINCKLSFCLTLVFCLKAVITGEVQRIYIRDNKPQLKGSDVQLVCEITDFIDAKIYSSLTKLPDILAQIPVITTCFPSGCLKQSSGRYTFQADQSNIYINITALDRSSDEKWWACAILNQKKQLLIKVRTVPKQLQFDNLPSEDQDLAQNAVTLDCSTGCAYPQPLFTWFYNEPGGTRQKWTSLGYVTEKDGGCTDSEKIYTSTLHLSKYATFPGNADKTVNFSCGITSFPGLTQPLYTKSSVNVRFAGSPNGPPAIQGFSNSSTLKVIEANQVTLSCSISGGNPLATLTWSCDDSGSPPVTDGKTVTKTVTWSTLRDKDQTCSCQSDHPVAGKQFVSIQIEVLYPPTKPSFRINSVTVSNTINVIRNNPLTVSCNSSGKPFPSYKWTLPTAATRGSTLNVSSVQKEGRYICKAENSMHLTNGSVIPGSNSSSVDVHLLYPPSKPIFAYGGMTGPSISSRSIDVIKDDTFSAACTSDGEPAPTYKWSNLPNNRILTVNRIAADQTYNCTASNRMNETVGESRTGSASAILSVNVQYPPRNVDIIYHYGKSSQMNITSLSIIEGNPFTMKCSSNSIPPPSYSWIGKVISNSETLTVESTQKTHVGTYTCNVENTMIRSFPNPQTEVKGTNSKSINLQVLYPPRIEDLRNQSAVEGEPFTMSCLVASGNPSETTYQWTRATDGRTWHTRTLTINAVSRADAMTYTCKVNNTMQQTGGNVVILPDTRAFYLDVWYSASVTNFSITGHRGETTVTKNEREKVTFECLVDSNPGSTILVMYQKNTKLSIANTKSVDYEIETARCTDRGAYSCVGFNPYNKENSSKTLNLLINCKPRPSPSLLLEENVTSALHTPAVLVFTTVAFPEPDFRWFRWNSSAWLELSNSDEFRIETAAFQSNLTIVDVKRILFGTYKLDVENQIGRYGQIFNLIPEDKPDPPTGFQHLEDTITQSSITVQWKRGFDNGPEQTFVLRYRKATETIWSSIKIADTGVSTMRYTIPNLSSGTEYDVVLFASNKLGNSSETETLRIKTKGELTPANAALIAGAVCGGLAFAVLVVVIFLLICRFRRNKGKANSQVELSGRARGENQDEDSSDDEVITENAMYVSAGNIGQKKLVDDNVYAKPQKKSAPNADVYAVVDKTKKSGQKKKKPEKKIKTTKGDIYENAPEPLSTNDGTYANSAYDENPYEATGAEASKKQKKNKDGLIYADLAFNDQPKGQKKLVIHGLDSMTEYVQVDFTKKADPLPDSDTEDQK